jgi:glutaredoxin 3
MSEAKVTIYTTTWCGFCKMAKNYMLQLGIPFVEKDVEQDEKAAHESVEKSGQMGVPVIDVNGTIILGFDRPGLDHALKQNDLLK